VTFSNVFIPGAGFMGSAIGYLIASKTNAKVILYDVDLKAVKKSQATVEKYCKTSMDKGFLSAEKHAEVKMQIGWTESLEAAGAADLVIEAIVEDMAAKQAMFKSLDAICKPGVIFASNTSALPITAMASVTGRSKQFLGMHFFSPAHIMKLLEIIPGIDTDESTVQAIKDFAIELGKTVVFSKDLPGFITSRLGMILCNEAAFALAEGLSTAEEIDTAMTLGFNHPMGPLALSDFIGLDVLLHILETLHDGFGDPKYRPCPLIRQLVSAGHLGRKSGQGFYKYEAR
jgi:3-hydroxybutyryl-CoA dehydrogenase